MKVRIRTELFGENLGNIIAGNSDRLKTAPKVSGKDFAPNLYSISNKETRNQQILEYIKTLGDHSERDDNRYKTCKKLIERLIKETKKHGDTPKDLVKTLEKTALLFKNKKSTSDSESSFGIYPKGDWMLSDFKKKTKDKDLLKTLFKKSKTDAYEHDPELVEKAVKGKAKKIEGHSSFPYLENQVPKLNASKVRIDGKVNFILSANPKDKSEVANHIYHAIIAENCTLWFTLNECNDKPKFWTKEHLKDLKLPGKWKVENIREEIVAEEGSKKSDPRLIQSTLLAKNGNSTRNITHYHFDNWLDHKPAPSEKMLLKCAKIAQKHLQETGLPVGINCRAGMGRTGNLAALILGMRDIDTQLDAGKELDEISINPTELNYALRKQRLGLVSHSPQFIQVCKVLGNYVEELQKESSSSKSK